MKINILTFISIIYLLMCTIKICHGGWNIIKTDGSLSDSSESDSDDYGNSKVKTKKPKKKPTPKPKPKPKLTTTKIPLITTTTIASITSSTSTTTRQPRKNHPCFCTAPQVSTEWRCPGLAMTLQPRNQGSRISVWNFPKMTWSQAKATCESFGEELQELLSLKDYELMTNFMKGWNDSWWVSMRNESSEGKLNNLPLLFPNMSQQTCLTVKEKSENSNQFTLENVDCNQRNKFMCQFTKDNPCYTAAVDRFSDIGGLPTTPATTTLATTTPATTTPATTTLATTTPATTTLTTTTVITTISTSQPSTPSTSVATTTPATTTPGTTSTTPTPTTVASTKPTTTTPKTTTPNCDEDDGDEFFKGC